MFFFTSAKKPGAPQHMVRVT